MVLLEEIFKVNEIFQDLGTFTVYKLLPSLLILLIGWLIGKIFGKTADIVDKVVLDKDLAAKLKADLQTQASGFAHDLLAKELDVRAGALAAELAGSDIQRNWRPHLMYVIMGLLIFLIAVVPIAALFGWEIPVKEGLESVPSEMWNLLTVASGGYIALRSGEKIANSFASRPK